MSNYYDTNKESYENPKSVAVYDAEKNKWSEDYVFKKYFKVGRKILDIGCGTGRTSAELFDRGLFVEGIDYSEAMIARAKEKLGSKISFKTMDASSLEYPAESFDYALFSFNGLDYLYPKDRRQQALVEISRVLKPEGIFVFSTHNSCFVPNNIYRLYLTLKSFLYGKVHPYRLEFHAFGRLVTHYISPRKQIEDLKSAGFECLEIVSKYSKNINTISLKDPYPTYVCRKISKNS